MSWCLHMPCNRPEWLDFTDRRNAVYSVVAGSLFAIGWWIMIDCASRHPSSQELNHAYHTIGVISTLSLIMVNVVSNAQFRGEGYTDGACGQTGAQVWLFIGFVLGFGALLGSSWILVATNFHGTSLSVFFQNVFIFASSMAFKFGRKEYNSWGG
ncbi:transmembrane protein 50B-like [Tropilaelaps mercedesae]|uniref:Transmembrane protein 50B-like n=1 Tax=Tropilaelaps mercedesae TaxID=418985 RepID=A0A1V9XGQ0_9ACAR|nr:transmembrane protein 50B-like [Tropilaelaps mercedesae]